MDGGGGDVKSRVERDGETERKRPGGTRRAGRNRERENYAFPSAGGGGPAGSDDVCRAKIKRPLPAARRRNNNTGVMSRRTRVCRLTRRGGEGTGYAAVSRPRAVRTMFTTPGVYILVDCFFFLRRGSVASRTGIKQTRRGGFFFFF